MERRVLISIGIHKTAGGFADLPGALAGAREMNRWGAAAGFEVDDDFVDKPVLAQALVERVQRLVEDGDVTKLIIYFAGHGMSTGLNEDFWILSGGTGESREIIDV